MLIARLSGGAWGGCCRAAGRRDGADDRLPWGLPNLIPVPPVLGAGPAGRVEEVVSISPSSSNWIPEEEPKAEAHLESTPAPPEGGRPERTGTTEELVSLTKLEVCRGRGGNGAERLMERR